MQALATQLKQNILGKPNIVELCSPLHVIKSLDMEEHDEVDNVLNGKLTCEKTKCVDQDSEMYKMDHKRRGVALIFNNVKMSSHRDAAEESSRNLLKTLEMMRFNAKLIVNATLQIVIQELKNVASEDHTNNDCLAIAVLTTGTSNLLKADNMFYTPQMLWTPFLSDLCPSLNNKPKLFFLQTFYDSSCTGTYGFDQSVNFSSPDIMVIHLFYNSSQENTRSCLMNKIIRELNEHWRTHDLLRMMTSVVKHIAAYNMTRNERNTEVPTIVSTLTRLVYFDKRKYLRELMKNERIDFDPLD